MQYWIVRSKATWLDGEFFSAYIYAVFDAKDDMETVLTLLKAESFIGNHFFRRTSRESSVIQLPR